MTALVDKAHDHITQLFLEELPTTCLYHNLVHTKRVLKSTKEILAETPLTDAGFLPRLREVLVTGEKTGQSAIEEIGFRPETPQDHYEPDRTV